MQDLWDNQCQNAGESKSDWLLFFTGSLRERSVKTGNKSNAFAGRFRSRQRRTMGKKSENGRCKLTKNRNTVKFKFMLEKTQKANWCRSHD